MILKLKRSIADFIQQGIPEVRCYADRTANVSKNYPCVYITEIDGKRNPLGCGRVDYTERSPLGTVVKNGKLIEYRTTLRFLIAAAGDKYESAADKARQNCHRKSTKYPLPR